MKFNSDFFVENQDTLLKCLNSPIGWVIRNGLWVEDKHNLIVKITPDSVHRRLPDGRIRVNLFTTDQHAQAIRKNCKPIWDALHWWDLRFANKFMPAWNAGFDSYSSQPDGTAGLDTWIQSSAPTTNQGTATQIIVGESDAAAATYRSLIKFDFTSITPPVTTSSVVFSLWQFAESSSNTRTFQIYRQLRDWVETQATWNIWKTSNNWATAGGFDAADCEQTGIASLSLSSTEAAGEKQWTNWTTASLDAMINGSFTNNGFMVKADTELNDAHNFRSSDYATAGNRPKLAFTYTPVTSGGGYYNFF